MREGDLPSTVEAPCGTINHDVGQGTAGMNIDESDCSHNATKFVKSDDGDVEMLTCGRHVDKARARVESIE